MKKVSVVIPIYNAEGYLGKCIDSIISQTWKNIEIILVDDGSKDGSSKICDEYAKKDNRIIVIHKENGGVSSARNRGIDASSGDYMLFVDSDDYISENYVESFFKCDEISNALIIEGCTVHEKSKIRYYRISEDHYKKPDFAKAISEHELFKHGSPYGKLYITSIIKDFGIRFNESIHNYEDFLFFAEYIKHVDNIVLSSDVGYHYNVYNGVLHGKINDYASELLLFKEYINKTKQYWYINGIESNVKKYLWPLMVRCIKSSCLYNKYPLPGLLRLKNEFAEYLFLPYYKCGVHEKVIAILFKRGGYLPLFLFVRLYSFIKNQQ